MAILKIIFWKWTIIIIIIWKWTRICVLDDYIEKSLGKDDTEDRWTGDWPGEDCIIEKEEVGNGLLQSGGGKPVGREVWQRVVREIRVSIIEPKNRTKKQIKGASEVKTNA